MLKIFLFNIGFGKEEYWQNTLDWSQVARHLGSRWTRLWQGHPVRQDRVQVWIHSLVIWRPPPWRSQERIRPWPTAQCNDGKGRFGSSFRCAWPLGWGYDWQVGWIQRISHRRLSSWSGSGKKEKENDVSKLIFDVSRVKNLKRRLLPAQKSFTLKWRTRPWLSVSWNVASLPDVWTTTLRPSRKGSTLSISIPSLSLKRTKKRPAS